MSHIHYKFSSKLNYDTVVFDGQRITLNELKRLIMCKEKLRAGDCDLQITNAQTKEEYTDSDSMIPRNSSVIVRRIPSSSTKIHNTEQSEVQLHRAFGASRAMDDHSSTRALSFFSKMQMANLVDADVSEEDKIKAMIYQSTYDSMNVHTKPSNALSVNYTCYRCGNPGHHIRNCPAKGDKNSEVPLRIKKSTGIPRSFMVEVDDPNIKGAKLTNCGRYAIPAIDAEAYAIGKKEKPPFLAKEQPESEDEDDPIPSELLCLICSELLTDAVVIPCCGNSYCDECIRTALLESEYHTCPTCDQSKVSPDTLIANKFLRQAVNNFKKEQGCAKSLRWRAATSQSQNLTPTPTPVPTPPPLPIQSQPQKPQQSSHNQQDSVLDDPKAANTSPLSQGPGVPPATTDTASDNDTTGISLQPLQSQLELPENETEGKTCDDSASAASVKVSNKDPTDAPSQPLTLDNHTLVAEQQLHTVDVRQDNQQHASSDPTPVYPESSVSLERSSSSSSACTSGGKTESNTQQLSTISTTSFSSTYSTTPPPLFPSLLTHTYLTAQQSHSTYPPRYPPATPIWTLPAPQGAPIPSLCSSTTTTTSTSSIPCLIPQEWYRYQKKKKDRSPHRVSSYRRSSSRSKTSRAKASCSYSRSSSRSVSRSRSRSRSRHRSPYSHHRDLHKHSRQPCSYSYGYKRSRSPTPSSSSSPRRHYQPRSKAPSGRKDHLHSHHHSKKISSSSNHSKRRAERSGKEAARSEDSVSRNTHTGQTGSLELDRECCLQWKKEYKEWYEKYFSSFSQFHHLPFPLLGLPPPPPPPQWVSTEGSRKQLHISLDSHYQSQGRRPTEIDGCTPSSELSSDSRSPPSHSSGDSRSMPSQSCSDSSSSLSYKASDSQSPPSQSSSDGRSTPSEDRVQLSVFPERHSETTRHKPVTLTRGNKKMKRQGLSTDNKQFKKLEDSSPLKHEEKEKKPEVKGSSPPDVTNCTHDSRKDKKRHNSVPQAGKDSTQIQGKATMSTALETDQPVPKQDQPLEKDCERKFIESNLENKDCWKRGKNLYSKEREREQKGKSSKEPDGMHKEREESPGGSKASDCRSEKNRKRKVEDLAKGERESSLPGELQCSRHLKTKTAEEPEKHVSEFLKPLDREKQKTKKKLEKKTSPLTGKDIWEEGMKVKPQMKISININLDGKRKEGNIGKHNALENLTGKLQENVNYTENRDEEEKVNRREVNEKEPSRNQGSWSEDKLKQGEGETRLTWDKFTFRVDKGEIWEKIPGDEENTVGRKHEKEEDLDLWHCALSGVEESATGKEEEKKVRDDDRDGEMGESQKEQEKRGQAWRKGLMESVEMRMRDEDPVISSPRSNEGHQDTLCTKLDDGSSTSVVGSCKGKESQEKRTEVKKLEKYTQDRWKELVHNQVSRSKCETEHKGKTRVHTDSVSVTLTHLSVTNSKAEGDEDQWRERHREKERNSAWSWSHRSVAPSSGKDRVENSMPAGADRETRKERERKRERERQQESKGSKERIREEGSGRDRARERKYVASSPTRTVPTSSQFYSFSTSQDAERRERQHGGSQGSNKSSSCSSGIFISFRNRETSTVSRAPDLANQNVCRTQRDLSLNLKYKDKDKVYFHYHNIHQAPSGSNQNKDKAPGSHHSQPSLSHSCSKGRDLLPFESSRYPQRESPNVGLIQGKVGKGEWKPNKADKLVREGKGERENRRMLAGQGGGSRWEDETDGKVDGEGERGGGRELEEGEMLSSQSSSVGSSPSEGNSKDDKGTEKEKKQKQQKKEKRQATPERLQEGELKKHKKLKKSKEGTDEETGGEEGDRWKHELNH